MPTTEPLPAPIDEAVLELAAELIRRPSVTPEDAGCQRLLGERLAALGFRLEPLRIGEVDNLWAVRGDAGPTLVFAGHTDVVPTGDAAAWTRPPFEPIVEHGMLHGRGAADMKGSLAAMIVAVERLLATRPTLPGRIAFLLTSDEEGPAVNGTKAVMARLLERGERMDWCVVGEPSSGEVLGDVVRVGRRGSLGGELVVHGVQGHVAYPQLARNPVHEALGALSELATRSWDEGNAHFPPTSFQISNVEAGTGATNVIPGTLRVLFNFRFCTEQSAAGLEAAVEALLDAHGLRYTLRWTRSGEPFLTSAGPLVDAVRTAIREISGVEPELSTGGGTSDGRFIAPHGIELVELGPCNATIHQVDERVPVAQLSDLARAYERIAERLLVADGTTQ
ncbi:MAG: succinyl-diaminopimelate desuccinylase [Pseudomonadales bacterium]|jgi:succinyl-diaminopimelate desuccinylase|nr:succinyl-diaminopimelate desuccinylase [Pseudomonadales bacterium]